MSTAKYFIRAPHTNITDENATVSELINPQTLQWDRNRDLLELTFSPENSNHISATYISRLNFSDKLVWHYTKDGVYSVRSRYHRLLGQETNQTTQYGENV